MKEPRFPKRTVIAGAVLLAADLGGARLLDALGLVEKLLSPHAGTIAFVLPLAVLFYGARLLLLFAVPGWVAGALLLWRLDVAGARRAKKAAP